MTQSVNDSRFHMWRTIFALIHADGKIEDKERNYAENYLAHVPFSENQKAILRSDIETPQNVANMFDGIKEPSDRTEFFEFAKNLLWSDGNYDDTEQKIFNHLIQSQMFRTNPEALKAEVRKIFDVGRLQREAADQKFKEQAGEILGPLAFLKGMVGR